MDFNITDEQREIKEMVRKFAAQEIAPLASKIDQECWFPQEVWDKMAALGLHGILVPEEYGGIGASVLTCCLVAEEVSYACASTALSYLAHAVLVCHNMTINASEEQKRKYLPDLASGKKTGCMAMTEPGAGSDALGLQTFAVRDGDEYVINGSKTFITNAPIADVFLVYVRTDKNAGPRGLSQFIIDKEAPGLSVGQPFHKMGNRGSPTAEIFFEDCRVPAENLVKGENQALGILLSGLDVERSVGGAMGVGGALHAIDKSLDYVKERQQFGQPLYMFEMILEKLANMSMELEAARLLTYRAATLCDEGVRCSLEAAHAKLFSSEMCMKTCSQAVQIFGGYGYMQEYEVERFMRDAKLGEIGAGTSEIQRLIIAKELLKRSMQ